MERSGAVSSVVMYTGLAIAGAAVGALLGGAPKLLMTNVAGGAARIVASPLASAPAPLTRRATYEVIAFEAPGCRYCENFRNDIARSYERSGRSKVAPVRFVDVNASEVSRLKLSHAITQLPTAVIMRDGEEVGRIGGYLGRENFFAVLDQVIGQVETK